MAWAGAGGSLEQSQPGGRDLRDRGSLRSLPAPTGRSAVSCPSGLTSFCPEHLSRCLSVCLKLSYVKASRFPSTFQVPVAFLEPVGSRRKRRASGLGEQGRQSSGGEGKAGLTEMGEGRLELREVRATGPEASTGEGYKDRMSECQAGGPPTHL